jgi:hypothetical protein
VIIDIGCIPADGDGDERLILASSFRKVFALLLLDGIFRGFLIPHRAKSAEVIDNDDDGDK